MASEHDWTGGVVEEGGEGGREGEVVQEEANQAARRAGGGANLQAIFCEHILPEANLITWSTLQTDGGRRREDFLRTN